MQLVKAALTNFRRFEAATLTADANIVALLGPNEAGKSSVLNALAHLNSDGAIPDSDLTRGQNVDDDTVLVRALFALDDQDRKAVDDMDPEHTIRWWIVERTRTDLRMRTEPAVPDTAAGHRKAAVDSMDTLLKTVSDRMPTDHVIHLQQLQHALMGLSDGVRPAPTERLNRIQTLADALRGLDPPGEISMELHRALSQTETVISSHQLPDPQAEAAEALWARTPDFVSFDNSFRDLKGEYALEEVAKRPPPALANLAKLARLDLPALLAEAKGQHLERVQKRLDEANALLAERISTNWSQAEVSVWLRTDYDRLSVLIRESGSDYSRVAERSDGLRAFIALVAFLAEPRNRQGAILLIDELETHLHYDAQADMVRMLSRQRVAQQVIYTTHSIGALPDDLGTGVRLVKPGPRQRSVIANSFWTEGAGLTPMYTAMGAAAAALALSHRYTVLTEGGVDVILLPSLVRSACGREHPGYQVAPGLAELEPSALARLDHEGRRVAYLVDADASGRRIAMALRKAGIDDARIVALTEEGDLVLEDLLHPAIYRQALCKEIERSHDRLDTSSLRVPTSGRQQAIIDWCTARDVDVPNKRNVAYRVLELARDRDLVDPSREATIRCIDTALRNALSLDL